MRDHCSHRLRRLGVIVLAVLLIVIALGTAHTEPGQGERAVDVGAFALGFAGAVALVLWLRKPVLMVTIVAAVLFTYLAVGYPAGPAFIAGPVSLSLLAVNAKRWVAWTAAAGMALAVTAGQLIGDGQGDRLAVAAVGWSLSAVLAGQLASARSERKHAEHERRRLTERQAVADERLRIAQDLHDSVAHAMATINVQAGSAAHLLARHPDRVEPAQIQGALDAIRAASGEVLDELGAILGVLRREESAERQPQLGLAHVEELAARARIDGLTVDVDVHPGVLPVAAPIDTTGYRLVQEALSNVRAHAGLGARVLIVVAASDAGGVVVSVIDDGGANSAAIPAGSTPGFGLIGMRERVEATGGSLVAGPNGAGFEVVAEWPGR